MTLWSRRRTHRILEPNFVLFQQGTRRFQSVAVREHREARQNAILQTCRELSRPSLGQVVVVVPMWMGNELCRHETAMNDAAIEAIHGHVGVPLLPGEGVGRDKNVSPSSSKSCPVGSSCRPVRAESVASASALATVWWLSDARQTTRIFRMGSSRKGRFPCRHLAVDPGLAVAHRLRSGRFRTEIGGGFGKLGQVLVGLAFFLQGLIEDIRHVLVSKGFGPALQRAVAGDFIVFHGGQRRSNPRRAQGCSKIPP